MHTIRVTSYLGDRDDMLEVLVIGPYPDVESRDAAIERLDQLPEVRGNLDLEPSELDPAGADWSATADAVADATSMEDIHDALFGR